MSSRGDGLPGDDDEFIEHLRSTPGSSSSRPDTVLAAYRAMPAARRPCTSPAFPLGAAVRRRARHDPRRAASSSAANYQVRSLTLGTSGYLHDQHARLHKRGEVARGDAVPARSGPGHHLQIGARLRDHRPASLALAGNFDVAYAEAGRSMRSGSVGIWASTSIRTSVMATSGKLHGARGWSSIPASCVRSPRDEALAYMEGRAGPTGSSPVSEVDRYFSNPAQALGYLLGLPQDAQLARAGGEGPRARFDVRDFRSVTIDNGSIPLAVLEKIVDEWIAHGGGANNP